MHTFRVPTVLALLCLACGAAAQAECPPWRPCGPGNSWGGNRCVRQGFYGADFRPACACHDACLQSGAPRYECDRQFLCHMYAACDGSCNPKKCYRKARCYYRLSRIFGGLWH